MRTATILIRKDAASALDEMGLRFSNTWKTGQYAGETFEFESPKALFSVITPRRWEMIERLQALGVISLRGLARELGRDVKRVHEDVAVLLEWGFVERDEAGKLHVPFADIHADFNLRAAA
jgi:predicted transcriptional regulator